MRVGKLSFFLRHCARTFPRGQSNLRCPTRCCASKSRENSSKPESCRVPQLERNRPNYVTLGAAGKLAEEAEFSEVQRFYQDEVIFITGSTGFLGKVLVEKLLRSCPGIKRIYLLIRPKKGSSPAERLEHLLGSECFKRLHQEWPSSLNKLHVIEGNLTEEKMGLNSSDYECLASEVSVVFHSAATIRFNDTLRNAVKMNMEGTKRVLDLCHSTKRMKAFVHVSTAYVNSDDKILEERVYSPTVEPDHIISLTKTMNEVDLQKLTPELLGAKPNTYVFTKSLAESIVAEHGRGLPSAIVRPSIVSPSWREPLPGWVEGLHGGNFLVASGVSGVLTTLVANKNAVMDLVPVDIVASTLIVAACQAASGERNKSRQQLREEPAVYNCTSGAINKLLYGEAARLTTVLARRYPSTLPFGRPGVALTMSPSYQAVAVFVFNYLPALIIDLMRQENGKNVRVADVVTKNKVFLDSVVFYITRSWNFSADKFLQLNDKSTPRDREIFNTDIRLINWATYWEDYVKGVRRYLLKLEPAEAPDFAKPTKRQKYLQTILAVPLLLGILTIVFGFGNI